MVDVDSVIPNPIAPVKSEGEEKKFTKEDLRTAFEAGDTHYNFEDWYIQQFD